MWRGCSCKTVPESCPFIQRYRQFCVTGTLCPIPSNSGGEGHLAAVWHWRKAAHASTTSGIFLIWSTIRQNSDSGTYILTGDDYMRKVGTKHAVMACNPVQHLTNFGETDTLLEQDVVLAEAVGLLGTCQGRGQVSYNWSDIPPV